MQCLLLMPPQDERLMSIVVTRLDPSLVPQINSMLAALSDAAIVQLEIPPYVFVLLCRRLGVPQVIRGS